MYNPARISTHAAPDSQGSRRADSAMKRVGLASLWVQVCMAMV